MALSALIRQRGVELAYLHLSEVEIADGCVSDVIGTYPMDAIVLAFGLDIGIYVKFLTFRRPSESDFGRDDEDDLEELNLTVPSATTTILLPDGMIWFTDIEEGQDVHWCIHHPDHPPLPGYDAAHLG